VNYHGYPEKVISIHPSLGGQQQCLTGSMRKVISVTLLSSPLQRLPHERLSTNHNRHQHFTPSLRKASATGFIFWGATY